MTSDDFIAKWFPEVNKPFDKIESASRLVTPFTFEVNDLDDESDAQLFHDALMETINEYVKENYPEQDIVAIQFTKYLKPVEYFPEGGDEYGVSVTLMKNGKEYKKYKKLGGLYGL